MASHAIGPRMALRPARMQTLQAQMRDATMYRRHLSARSPELPLCGCKRLPTWLERGDSGRTHLLQNIAITINKRPGQWCSHARADCSSPAQWSPAQRALLQANLSAELHDANLLGIDGLISRLGTRLQDHKGRFPGASHHATPRPQPNPPGHAVEKKRDCTTIIGRFETCRPVSSAAQAAALTLIDPVPSWRHRNY